MKTEKLIEIIVAELIDFSQPMDVKIKLQEDYEIDVPIKMVEEVFQLLESDLDVLHGYIGSYMSEDMQEVIFDKVYETYITDLDIIADKYKMNVSFDNA